MKFDCCLKIVLNDHRELFIYDGGMLVTRRNILGQQLSTNNMIFMRSCVATIPIFLSNTI